MYLFQVHTLALDTRRACNSKGHTHTPTHPHTYTPTHIHTHTHTHTHIHTQLRRTYIHMRMPRCSLLAAVALTCVPVLSTTLHTCTIHACNSQGHTKDLDARTFNCIHSGVLCGPERRSQNQGQSAHLKGAPPRTLLVVRVGQNRIYTLYMTVYLVIFLPKITYIHRIYIYKVLANLICDA